ncbi:1,2-phenylacetyl-CoA epoxidase subunit PaaE [Limobrevibacterium gyesilva]|uniref:Phenylacetate-CoA oxygenase/reductase subunit PaaK n=1 Tax=Limobrevibacterium gyesilva TaxID=2991712 RepID=A0AA41YQF6_9PROT|nr:1,2-phenylacetyl-CoA epoxidase subunit PaaE [Limobrevibacterium gyesilva]MCW3476970.1 phenylacetate-CoA oxygenase/reductase subunit PaaK [Limobrevibacterium gyesilva]
MPETVAATHFHPLRVADVRRETPDTVSIAFDVPSALRDAFSYAPGQYLTLRTRLGGEEVRRSYSICAGLDDNELRVAIKRVPQGAFSQHANTALRAGDTIDVMPPAGRFGTAIAPGLARVHVAVAAGSGITPILSIMKTVLTREPASRFILFYGSRSTAQIIFREALEDLKDRFLDRLSVFHVLSREEQDIAVLSGRLDGEKLRALLPTVVAPPAIDHAFVCGPAGMIDDVSATLQALGVQPARIHVERFTPAGGAIPAPRPVPVAADAPAFATATVIHDGKATDIPLAEGEAILDAAMRAGLDLPWSCRGGMCSTCRAKLQEGEVAMDQNFALEPWETDAGYILTCQSHPTTKHVTVDYDHV